MKRSLYQINEEIHKVLQLGEEGEIPEEAIADTLEALNMEFFDKADAVLAYRQSLEYEANAYKAEIGRLTLRKEQAEAHSERLKDYVVDMLQSRGETKHQGLFSLTIGKPSESVQVEDISLLDEEFIKVTYSPDRTAIRTAIKAGKNVAGAELVAGKNRIIIK